MGLEQFLEKVGKFYVHTGARLIFALLWKFPGGKSESGETPEMP